MTQSAGDIALLVAAGLGAGVVNGVAGGGTLISFPALLATGVPALQANITSTIGIWPGYLGGVAGFRDEVREQKDTRRLVLPALVGAAGGAVLLLTTPASDFKALAPYLVLAACLLFAVQPILSRKLAQRGASSQPRWAAAGIGTCLASVYGGYFGAGLGVILLALLSLTLPLDMVRTNSVRAVLSLAVNTVAALIFVFAAHVDWRDVGLLACGSLVGGYLGARLARRMHPAVFRGIVILLGLATAAKLLA